MVTLFSHRNKFSARRISEGGSCVWVIEEVAIAGGVGVYKNHLIEFNQVTLSTVSLIEIHDLILTIRRYELSGSGAADQNIKSNGT